MCVSTLTTAMSMGEAGGWAQLIGSAANAYGSYSAGSTRGRMAEADALSAQATAQAKAGRIREAGRRAVAGSRADTVAAGVSVRSGSALLAEHAINRYSEQDALTAILSGEHEAVGLRASGAMYRAAGVNQAVDSLIQGGSAWARTRRQRPESPTGWAVDDSYVRRGQRDW